jgi:hypothetical protein
VRCAGRGSAAVGAEAGVGAAVAASGQPGRAGAGRVQLAAHTRGGASVRRVS